MAQVANPTISPAPAAARSAPGGKFAFFKGAIVPIADAKISIMTQVVNYGIGAFAGIRGYWNEEREQLYIFRIDDHYRRFLNSAKLFNVPFRYNGDDLKRHTLALLQKEGYRQDVYIRPLMYSATEDITPRLYDVDFDFALFSRPMGNYIDAEVNACTSSWRRLDDTIIPARGKITGGYVNSAFAKSEAHWNGYDDAIVLNQDGHVAEGSAMNLMIVRDGRVITSPVADNILEGITRRSLFELVRNELGLEIAERSLDRSELYIADEVFFCGTGAQVSAVSSIDHRTIGSGKMGPITKQIQELYFDVVRGRNQKYSHWLTPVYRD